MVVSEDRLEQLSPLIVVCFFSGTRQMYQRKETTVLLGIRQFASRKKTVLL